MISYGKQTIDQNDIDSIVRILTQDYLTQGPIVEKFETELSSYFGATHCCVVANGTAALHLAGIALGWGEGDIVITSPITFLATANAILYAGATPDFVDIDPSTWCLSAEKLQQKLDKNKSEGKPLPKVVIPVHLSGQSCDMQAISELGEKYGFSVVEDASHALGGSFQDGPVGNCIYSDITIFSFHPVKMITSGEGGMVLTF